MKRITDIKRVITPIDFSENAPLIAESAAYVAGSFKASLSLIFVVQSFADYSGFFVPQINAPDLMQELFTSAEERMDKFCQDNEENFKALGVTANYIIENNGSWEDFYQKIEEVLTTIKNEVQG